MLRPRTARQQLHIDVYTARGIFKSCDARTIEGLAHLIITQTRLRGGDYVLLLLQVRGSMRTVPYPLAMSLLTTNLSLRSSQEAVKSATIARSLQKSFDCMLQGGDKVQEATRHWNANHPYTQSGTYVPNELANNSRSSALVQNENKMVIVKLRERRDNEIHHIRTGSTPLATTFLSEANTTDMLRRKLNKRHSNYSKTHPHLPKTLTRQLSQHGGDEEYEMRRLSSGTHSGKMSNNDNNDDDGVRSRSELQRGFT